MNNGTNKTKALKRSTLVGFLVFAVFGVLLLRILIIQTVSFEKYQSKVINQMTTESAVLADRGKIYDRNGNVLATNITTYRVFISPSGIAAAEEKTGKNYTEAISTGLSALLENVTYEKVYEQATKYTDKLDNKMNCSKDYLRKAIKHAMHDGMTFWWDSCKKYEQLEDKALEVLARKINGERFL